MRPMLYRVFLASLTVFFIGMSVFGSFPARAQGDEALLVKGVTVDVSASSALEARKKAFSEARRKAYEQVAGSMIPASERANLVIPDDRIIASMVKDIEIVKEKMTSRRYTGTLDVRFTPALKRSVSTAGVALPDATLPGDVITTTTTTGTTTTTVAMPTAGMGEEYIYSPRNGGAVRNTVPANKPVAVQARTVLILPWYGPMGRQTLWGQGNPWRAAWEENAALSRDKSMPILLPVGDVDDLRDYSPPQPLSRRGDIDSLLKRYRASEAVLAMAEPNDQGAQISLYRYEGGSPVPVGRFMVDDTSRDMLGEAVQKAAIALRNTQAIEPQVAPTPVSVTSTGMVAPIPQVAAPVGGTYRTLARFSGLQEWVAMRAALTRVPGLGVVGIRSISPSQANIEFSYGGDPTSLTTALAQGGMVLAPVQGNVPVAAGTPQYLLSMSRGY